jgi:hypothetical protein
MADRPREPKLSFDGPIDICTSDIAPSDEHTWRAIPLKDPALLEGQVVELGRYHVPEGDENASRTTARFSNS